MTEWCSAGVPDDEGRGGCRWYDSALRQPAQLTEKSRLCDGCLEIAERDVRALVLDYRDLEQHLPPALGVWSDGQPRGRSIPLPLRESVLDLQMLIHWLTDAWDDVVRDRDRLSAKPSRVRAGWSVQQSVSILAPRLRLLAEISEVEMWCYPGTEGATLVAGWQGVLDLARLHHRARSMLGLTNARPELCLGVPCRNPDCDTVGSLYREAGEDSVRCGLCGEWLDADAYASWVALVAANARPAA